MPVDTNKLEGWGLNEEGFNIIRQLVGLEPVELRISRLVAVSFGSSSSNLSRHGDEGWHELLGRRSEVVENHGIKARILDKFVAIMLHHCSRG